MKPCYLFIGLFFISANFWLSGCSSNILTTETPNKTVVLGHNSTNVEFRWMFTLKEKEEMISVFVKRNIKYNGTTKITFLVKHTVVRNDSQLNSSLYTFTHNYTQGSLSGYFSFTIKDITKQQDNTDGSKFRYLSDELSYLLEVTYLNDPVVRKESKIQLWISSLPRIFFMTPHVYAKQGDSITLRCIASGRPAPRAAWINKDKNTVIAHSYVTSFNITSKASGGKYCCNVTNRVGDATNCTSISVMEPPKIVTHWHQPVTMNETNKIFECSATGIPTPNITWYTTNNTVGSESRGKLLKIMNEDCKNVTLEYYCKAVNDAGEAKTNLTVIAFCTTQNKGNKDDSTPPSDEKRKTIIVVIVCILVLVLVLVLVALVLLLVFILRKRKRAKRDIIKERRQRDSRQNQLAEECPYGEPIDAVRTGMPASGSNADYATVEETGYRRVKTSNHLQEPRHGSGSSSNKATKPTLEPVYAKVKKKKKKDITADIPMASIYAEITGKHPQCTSTESNNASQ